jgi:protein-S-isoprenylcysteine O-methyltransferase Ste14
MNKRVIVREELDLEERFGASYLEYKNRVPRWLGKIGH